MSIRDNTYSILSIDVYTYTKCMAYEQIYNVFMLLSKI